MHQEDLFIDLFYWWVES